LRSGPCMEILRESGFHEIWLVGPTADHAYQLDE
jgi:hypothetical protein